MQMSQFRDYHRTARSRRRVAYKPPVLHCSCAGIVTGALAQIRLRILPHAVVRVERVDGADSQSNAAWDSGGRGNLRNLPRGRWQLAQIRRRARDAACEAASDVRTRRTQRLLPRPRQGVGPMLPAYRRERSSALSVESPVPTKQQHLTRDPRTEYQYQPKITVGR
jgi:hypothetical protein